jgi:tRNA pseudouridine55 synthase
LKKYGTRREINIINIKELIYYQYYFFIKYDKKKGTYIRSLGRDISFNLGTFSHIKFLKRIRVENFCSYNAISLEKIKKMGHRVVSSPAFISITETLNSIPKINIKKGIEQRINQGKSTLTKLKNYDMALAINNNTKTLSIGLIKKNIFKPNRVFKL